MQSGEDAVFWVAVCLSRETWIWRGQKCSPVISALQIVSSGVPEMRGLKKVNNVESSAALSSWYHIPSENRSFSAFIGPIRLTSALLLLCNIEDRGEEQREEIPIQTVVLQYCDFFISFMSLSRLPPMEKSNLTEPGTEVTGDEIIPPSAAERFASVIFSRLS